MWFPATIYSKYLQSNIYILIQNYTFQRTVFFYKLYQLYICQSLECLEIVYLQGRFKTYSYRVASRDFCISESWFVTTYGLDFALEIIKVKICYKALSVAESPIVTAQYLVVCCDWAHPKASSFWEITQTKASVVNHLVYLRV